MVKNPPANAGDLRDAGSIPGWRRSPGEGHGNHSSIQGLLGPRLSGGGQKTAASQETEGSDFLGIPGKLPGVYQIYFGDLLIQGELSHPFLLQTDPSHEMGQPQWIFQKCASSGKPRTDHHWLTMAKCRIGREAGCSL